MTAPGHAAPAEPAQSPGPAPPAVRSWPLLVLALPAAITIWSGWVGIGQMTGFGIVRPLPGLWTTFRLNTAITLPAGVEAYAAYALRAWLSASPRVSGRTRRFARRSATASLLPRPAERTGQAIGSHRPDGRRTRRRADLPYRVRPAVRPARVRAGSCAGSHAAPGWPRETTWQEHSSPSATPAGGCAASEGPSPATSRIWRQPFRRFVRQWCYAK